MINKVYNKKTYQNIIKNFSILSFKEKYELINYLFITGNKDKVFNLLKEMYQAKLSKTQMEKLDYLQLIYHINNEDKYNINAVKYKLIKENPKRKWFYNLVCEEDANEQMKILKDLTNSKMTYILFKLKKYRNRIIYLYLTSFGFLDEPIRIKYIEKYINKSIIKLNRKEELSIADISYIEKICNIIFSGLSYIYIKNNEYFLDFSNLYNLIAKTIKSKKQYVDYTKNATIAFNTIMFYAMRGILNLDIFSMTQNKDISEKINKFVEENINEIDENIKISRNINKTNFLEELESILKQNKKNINITDLLLTHACIEYKRLTEICLEIDKLYDKYKDDVSQSLKHEFLLGREILNLWNNGVFKEENIGERYKTSDFISLVIKLFNGTISKNGFLFELQNIKSINCFEIINWDMLEQKLNGVGNYEWLITILEKIDNQLDEKGFEYLRTLYMSILNNKKAIFLQEFIQINDIVLKRYDESYFFLVNAINILYYFYEDFNEAEGLIQQVIKVWDKIRVTNKPQYLVNIIMILIEKKSKKINFEEIYSIISKTEVPINKNLLYLYMSSTYKEIELVDENYENILKYIIETYKDIDNITDLLYRIIASMAIKYLENKEDFKFTNYDLIYYKNNKHFYLKTNNVLLNECYNIFQLEEISNIEGTEKEHMIMFIISRIFFAKMEEKGVGKKIMLPSDANAKEIVTELNKAIGYDKILDQKKEIREGNIVDIPWLNIYDYNSMFEDVVSAKWKIFYNSSNKRFLSTKKIIHLSSLILLSKIDKLSIIEENECYVSNEIYEETIKRNKKEIVELGKGILEEAVFYEEDLDKLALSLQRMKKKGKIFNTTKANILPKGSINKFDDEIMKKFVENIKDKNDFCLITEDPFFLIQAPFSDMSEGTVSLLIDSYIKQKLSSKELYDSINELNKLNYNLNIGKILYSYLLSKADDEYIKNIIMLINNYKINSSN